MPIEAVLDLHGYGQMDAREALHGFLAQAWARAARCVLVITGKGLRNEGVLRTRLPEWLADGAVRRMVLAHAPARAHGGAGAFYILLRRRRECGP
ncbi:MAG: Smr/MutS family protein [Alphaproteobacteria bacterium]|nr:Smr/MutS family protein [Alphaproteobacteria bacterium]